MRWRRQRTSSCIRQPMPKCAALAADLQVLGRSEFKQLLKWCVLVLQSLLTDFDWESWWLV